MSTSPTTATRTSLFLLPDTVAEANGSGLAFELGPLAGKLVMLVLGISDIIEQEALHVSIWGLKDGTNWGEKVLFWFPEKFYCGVTPAALDLRQVADIKFLQARWEVNRWGRGYPMPYFKFRVEILELAQPGP